MNIRKAAGPMSLISLACGTLYTALKMGGASGNMGAGFLLLGLIATGFGCAAIFGGLWLDKIFQNKRLTSLPYCILIGLVFAAGASAIILAFAYIGFFALVALLTTLFTAISLSMGLRLLFASGKSISPLLYSFTGALLALAGIAANAFILYSFV